MSAPSSSSSTATTAVAAAIGSDGGIAVRIDK